MLHPSTATPGASAAHPTLIHPASAGTRPLADPPLDGTPAAAAPPAGPPATDPGGGPAGTEGGAGGQVPPAPPGQGATGVPPAAPPAGGAPLFTSPATPPAPTPPPVVVTPPPGAPPAPGTPPAGLPAGTKPASERGLDEFPADVRDYIKELRTEAGDNRIRAKTADDRLAEQQKQWLDNLAKAFGLTADVPEAQQTPEQQVAALTEQLAGRDADHRAAQVELAIWKGATAHDAHPGRLTDSRTFMKAVAGLDPSAADFDQQVAAAIGTAVAADPYYKATPVAGQAPPPVPPPVPSGGDFAGGPSAGGTEPQTVEDFRAEMRKRRSSPVSA